MQRLKRTCCIIEKENGQSSVCHSDPSECIEGHSQRIEIVLVCVYVYRREQILVGRKKMVSHPISKFRDGVRAGITFDRGIGIRIKLPFYQLVKRGQILSFYSC